MGIFHGFLSLYNRFFASLERFAGNWFLPTLARAVFAGVFLTYYWNSAMLKVGEGFFGLFSPTIGAYAQIVPHVAEAASYDVSQIAFFPYTLIVFSGTLAEFILPALIVIGLLTRLASLGMIGFVIMQSYVDITAHGVGGVKGLGSWFDNVADSVILDQRALWIFLLLFLVIRGAGSLSLDALIGNRKVEVH